MLNVLMDVCTRNSFACLADIVLDSWAPAWGFQQAEEMAAWEKAREEDRKTLQRDRAALERQSKALVRLPTRKEHAEVSPLTANKHPQHSLTSCSLRSC